MARAHVQVRRVDASRVESVVQLWQQLRDEGGSAVDLGCRRPDADLVRAALARPETAAFVALLDGAAVGYVVATDCSLNPFAEGACVSVEQLFVAKEARKSGVAKALMSAVTSYAERQDADQIACSVPAGVRDSNRFFARLGFTPVTTRRLTATAALRRKLSDDSDVRRFALDQVLTRRREARWRSAQPSH